MKICVIDYNAGNLKSVENILTYLGAEYFISSDPEVLAGADRVIFPGVGEAGSALKELQKKSLDEAIKVFIKTGKLFLGICIGCQILFELSEESNTKCLGIIKGSVKKFAKSAGYKIPHMGWNRIKKEKEHPVLKGLPEDASFYFVHSYYPDPLEGSRVLTSTEYGMSFASGVSLDNVTAVQFHPEKSGVNGIKFLKNFLKMKDQ